MAKVKASGIFIVRKNKTLLVCHPTNHAPNFWSIPKGKIEDGETILEAGLRETFEESNIDLISLGNFSSQYLGSTNYGHNKKMLYAFLYHEHDASDIDWDKVDIKCTSNVPDERGGFPEMDGFAWTTLDEARQTLHETQVFFLDDIAKIINL
jgi:8-oxo-dGTP pyrophosphatase MutT (NUDIX family)